MRTSKKSIKNSSIYKTNKLVTNQGNFLDHKEDKIHQSHSLSQIKGQQTITSHHKQMVIMLPRIQSKEVMMVEIKITSRTTTKMAILTRIYQIKWISRIKTLNRMILHNLIPTLQKVLRKSLRVTNNNHQLKIKILKHRINKINLNQNKRNLIRSLKSPLIKVLDLRRKNLKNKRVKMKRKSR